MGGSGGFVSASASAVTLKQVASYGTSAAVHGGLVHGEGASVTLIGVNATESEAANGYGGVVNLFAGVLAMSDFRTMNTSAAKYGGMTNIAQGSIASISNVVATNTFAGEGGGLFAVVVSCHAVIENVTLTNAVGGSLAKVGGGAFVILVGGSTLRVSNVVADNLATYAEPGGGFAFVYKSAAFIGTGINVVNTHALSTGGFLNCLGSPLTITDLNVNNATALDGGLLFLSGCNGVEMTRVNTVDTGASRNGGLVNALGSSFTLTDVFATNSSAGVVALIPLVGVDPNSAGGESGLTGAIDGDTDGSGGLVFSSGCFSTMTRVVAENTVAAKHGGLLYLDGESQVQASEMEATLTSAGVDGGLVHIEGDSTFQATGIKAVNTTAGRKGGLVHATKYAAVRLSDLILEQTKAGQDGGLVHVSDDCTIDLDNVVALGTSADRDGGFIHASAGSMIQVDGVFAKGTSAGQNGGLIDAGEGCTVEIANSVATDTSAGKHGGLVYIPGSALVQFNNFTGKTVTAATSAGLSALLGKQARLVLQSSQFLDVSAASAPIALIHTGQIETLHVEIFVVGCEAAAAPYIVNNGTGSLVLRDLQIDDACASSSAAPIDQMPHVAGALTCAEEMYTDATTGKEVPICGPVTTCIDNPILKGSSTTGPQCACLSGALRSLATVSFEDAPYLAGDFCECDAGFLPSDGGGPCLKCPIGTFKSEIGSGACLACDQHRTTLDVGSNSAAMCVCKEQFVLDGDGDCTPCLSITDGAICEAPNMTVLTLLLKPEYWRISSTSLDVRKCRGDTATTPCAGGAAASCANHHGGPKCEVCTTDGYYFDKGDAACKQCPEGACSSCLTLTLTLTLTL